MRRMECALLAALLVLGLCGCGQRPAAAASSAGGTWQEQYDLGMKYLEDGRYAEAVEAFTAAIQIDPKQAPAYLGLADAYVGQGDYENAKKALKDGLSATGDESLQTRLDELNSGGERQKSGRLLRRSRGRQAEVRGHGGGGRAGHRPRGEPGREGYGGGV